MALFFNTGQVGQMLKKTGTRLRMICSPILRDFFDKLFVRFGPSTPHYHPKKWRVVARSAARSFFFVFVGFFSDFFVRGDWGDVGSGGKNSKWVWGRFCQEFVVCLGVSSVPPKKKK